MEDISRRDAISRIAGVSAGLALGVSGNSFVNGNDLAEPGGHGSSAQAITARAFRGQHQAQALPFDPAKLRGLSEKLIRSHWENNYGGAVKALNAVEQRLAAILKEKDLPAYFYGDLKREELVRSGSVVLPRTIFCKSRRRAKAGRQSA